MSSQQNKKNVSIRELCTDVVNFFEATPTHIFTKSPLEKLFETHKNHNGKNIVLLVSNGVEKNNPSILYPFRTRILEQHNLRDQEVEKLGHDRNKFLYGDIVTYINKGCNKDLPPYSQAHLLSHTDYASDQDLLNNIQDIIKTKKEPQFIVALLNSSFLTQSGALNQNAKNISNLIENLNGTGTIYLLSSTHKLTQEKTTEQEQLPSTYRTHVLPVVPLIVAAELLRKTKQKEIAKTPIDWRRSSHKQIDFACLLRQSHHY